MADDSSAKAARKYHLDFKKSQGTLTDAEADELRDLQPWFRNHYGIGTAAQAEDSTQGVDTSAPSHKPFTPQPDVFGGGANETADLEGQLAEAGQYGSISEWSQAMSDQLGKGVPGYDPSTGKTSYTSWGDFFSMASSPTANIAKGAMGLPVSHESRYALNDPGRIDYQDLGINAAPGDQFGYEPDVDKGPMGDLDAFGAAGPDVDTGSSVGAVSDAEADADVEAGGYGDDFGDFGDYNDGDFSDFRRGGLIRGDRDGVLEPRTIEAHESEYVLRPEAVEAIGVPALDQLNRMGRNPKHARQSSGIPALDALAEMPRKKTRGLYLDRKMGRVMGGV